MINACSVIRSFKKDYILSLCFNINSPLAARNSLISKHFKRSPNAVDTYQPKVHEL